MEGFQVFLLFFCGVVCGGLVVGVILDCEPRPVLIHAYVNDDQRGWRKLDGERVES